jgi:tetratricopeptide (TPR) repeat protein
MSETPAADKNPGSRYRVFISYSHADRKWARWLHRSLESYRPPRGVVTGDAPVERRQKPLSPVFRDREELSSAASLSDAVSRALQASETLVVICSPAAARSKWVNEEILNFRRLGRSSRIFCFVVDGEPNSGDASECFPRALRYEWKDGDLSDVPAEPLAADARPVGDGRTLARLKLIAGILQVDLDNLRQRDLQRRNRRLLAISGGSAAIAVLTITLAVMAFLSSTEAQRRRAQAEDLIGFMIGDLYTRLWEIGRLEDFMSIGNKAMDYFSSLHDEEVDDKVLSQRADVLTKIGNVRQNQGELAAALDSFREARAISVRLAESDPSSAERQIALANSHFWIGLVYWQRGELQAAEKEFQSEIPIVDRVVAQDPDNPKWLAERGYAYTNLARVLELQGQLEASLQLYREIAVINDKLLAMDPDNEDFKLEVGFAHNNIGKVVQSLGRLEEARLHFQADLDIKQAMSDSKPSQNVWRGYLATSQRYLGRNAMARGDYEAARQAFTAAIDIFTSLHQLDSENTEWMNHLATCQRELAAVEIELAQMEPAGAALGVSSALYRQLLQIDDKKWAWKTGGSLTGIYQALVALAEGDGQGALNRSSPAKEALKELLDQDPSNTESRKNLMFAGLVDGDALYATGSQPSALAAWQDSLALLDAITPTARTPEMVELAAALQSRLGRDDEAQKNLDVLADMGYQPTLVHPPGLKTGPGREAG